MIAPDGGPVLEGSDIRKPFGDHVAVHPEPGVRIRSLGVSTTYRDN
jgi:hypothetical protein